MKNLKSYFFIIVSFFIFFYSFNVNATVLDDVTFHVPDSTQIVNYNDFYLTNSDTNKLPNADSFDDFLNSNKSRFYQTHCFENKECDMPTNSSFYLKDNITLKKRITNDNNEIAQSYGYYFRFNFNRNYFKLEKDTKYQILFKFNKSKSIDYINNLKISDITTEINLIDLDSVMGNTEKLTNDKISILETEFLVERDSENTKENSNYSYLLITFQINSDDLVKLNNLYIDYIDVKTDVNSLKSFLKNNTTKDLEFRISYFAFMENSSIQINKNVGSSGGSHGTGGGRHDNLDKVHEDDIIIFNDYEICETGDLFCLLRNVFAHLKNFFIRVGNGLSLIANLISNLGSYLIEKIGLLLKNLFVPSQNFMTNFINNFKDLFLNKLGFLSYPFELIGNLLNKYLNLTTNPIINIPDIREPFSNHVLISARSFNFQDYFSYGSMKTVYDIYMSFVSVIIIFGFGNYSIKKFNEFVKNRGGAE